MANVSGSLISYGAHGASIVSRKCSDTGTISKYTGLVLLDANLVSGSYSTTLSGAWGGIASADKVSGDGSTTIGAYIEGCFDMKCADAVTTGDRVTMSGSAGIIRAYASDLLAGHDIGVAEEDGTANEVIRVRLRGY